jgi:DnaK suppressor protein
MSITLSSTAQPEWLREVSAALASQLEEQTARLTELTADTGDPEREYTNQALVAATRQSVDEISAALARIAGGSYGVCEKCARDIPRERMLALPHARRCVPCQERYGR